MDVWELGEEMSRGGYAGGRPEGRGVLKDGEDMVALYIRIIQLVYLWLYLWGRRCVEIQVVYSREVGDLPRFEQVLAYYR